MDKTLPGDRLNSQYKEDQQNLQFQQPVDIRYYRDTQMDEVSYCLFFNTVNTVGNHLHSLVLIIKC